MENIEKKKSDPKESTTRETIKFLVDIQNNDKSVQDQKAGDFTEFFNLLYSTDVSNEEMRRFGFPLSKGNSVGVLFLRP